MRQLGRYLLAFAIAVTCQYHYFGLRDQPFKPVYDLGPALSQFVRRFEMGSLDA